MHLLSLRRLVLQDLKKIESQVNREEVSRVNDSFDNRLKKALAKFKCKNRVSSHRSIIIGKKKKTEYLKKTFTTVILNASSILQKIIINCIIITVIVIVKSQDIIIKKPCLIKTKSCILLTFVWSQVVSPGFYS